jgi:hypothetical protein
MSRFVLASLLVAGVSANAFAQQPPPSTPGKLVVEQIQSVGYRKVGNAPLLGDELNGVSGSVAFQIGGK